MSVLVILFKYIPTVIVCRCGYGLYQYVYNNTVSTQYGWQIIWIHSLYIVHIFFFSANIDVLCVQTETLHPLQTTQTK